MQQSDEEIESCEEKVAGEQSKEEGEAAVKAEEAVENKQDGKNYTNQEDPPAGRLVSINRRWEGRGRVGRNQAGRQQL